MVVVAVVVVVHAAESPWWQLEREGVQCTIIRVQCFPRLCWEIQRPTTYYEYSYLPTVRDFGYSLRLIVGA